jgi:hypothetical protein
MQFTRDRTTNWICKIVDTNSAFRVWFDITESESCPAKAEEIGIEDALRCHSVWLCVPRGEARCGPARI